MPELRLLEAERVREKLTVTQEKHIKKLYKEALKEVQDWSKSLEGKDNISSTLRDLYLKKMESDLMDEMEKIGTNVESSVRENILTTATAVVKNSNKALNDFGINLSTAHSFVPADVVESITTGKIYAGNWTLSGAIWSDVKKSQKSIQDIIAKGVLENKSSYEIAKELEKFVNPSAVKPWDWSKIYPGTSKKIDYNAQRLARTMVSHAYQQSFVRVTKDNPFYDGYRWLTANNHRVCPICQGYAENVHAEGLPEGVFRKDELPIDHPNGQCTFSVYMIQTTDQIVNSLINWAHGEKNAELDGFAKSLGFSIDDVKKNVKKNETKSETKKTKKSVDTASSKSSKAFDIQDATSVKEISTQMSKNKWFAGKAYLSGCDLECAKAIYSGYERVFERYPTLIGKFYAPEAIVGEKSNVYASTDMFVKGRVMFNKAYFSDYNKTLSSMKKNILVSFHPKVDPGREVESIVIHEIGHSIDGYLTGKGYSVKQGSVGYSTSSAGMYEKILKEAGGSRNMGKNIGYEVSGYAKRNEAEFFAECFTQGMSSTEGSNYSRAFMRLLDEAIEEVSKND